MSATWQTIVLSFVNNLRQYPLSAFVHQSLPTLSFIVETCKVLFSSSDLDTPEDPNLSAGVNAEF